MVDSTNLPATANYKSNRIIESNCQNVNKTFVHYFLLLVTLTNIFKLWDYKHFYSFTNALVSHIPQIKIPTFFFYMKRSKI